uniref:V-type proton ATPase subunit G n=1 Tax=Acrobeloides nanus TaxID=290746 RepID=A0A914C7J9_9BILA
MSRKRDVHNLSQNKKIQYQLEDAEKCAQQVIKDTRDRSKLLVQRAKEEADQEIALYKKKKEFQHNKLLDEHNTGIVEDQKVIEKDVKHILKSMDDAIIHRKDKVIKMLLNAVIDIQPKIYKNLSFHRHLEQRHTAQNELNTSNQESPNKSTQKSPYVSDLNTPYSSRSPSSIGTNTAIHN